jgi:uncharacterized membrane protein YhaH (DUF805 family)
MVRPEPSSLLLSFEGRIGRKPFWLWSMALLLGFLIAAGLYGALLAAANPGLPDDALLARSKWGVYALYLVVLWPLTALMAKRFHDRGRSGWLSLVPVVPSVVYTVAIEVVGDPDPSSHSPLLIGLGILVAATSLWALVETGLRQGTRGSNAYGPEPSTQAPDVPHLR